MMSEIPMPANQSKRRLQAYIKKLSPAIRGEFLKEGQKVERSAHIRTKENGKFCVDLHISLDDDKGWVSDQVDKEFNSFKDADDFLKEFFAKNPEMSNYKDLET